MGYHGIHKINFAIPSISKLCADYYKQHVNINDKDLCIEPSAGNGSFIFPILDNFKNYKFYDIEPKNDTIETLDFLKFNSETHIDYNYKNIHIIGNPPFGRQSSMALKFLKKCATFCNYIGFILPKSFKKDSMKNKIPNNFHNIFGRFKQIPLWARKYSWCSMHISSGKKNIYREKQEKLIKNYKFVKQNEQHDIAFKELVFMLSIYKETEDKSFQSHYFIKFDNFDDELFEKLKKLIIIVENTQQGLNRQVNKS